MNSKDRTNELMSNAIKHDYDTKDALLEVLKHTEHNIHKTRLLTNELRSYVTQSGAGNDFLASYARVANSKADMLNSLLSKNDHVGILENQIPTSLKESIDNLHDYNHNSNSDVVDSNAQLEQLKSEFENFLGSTNVQDEKGSEVR